MDNSGERNNDGEVRLAAKSRPLPPSPLSDDDFQPKRTGPLPVCRKIFSNDSNGSNNGTSCPFCNKALKTKKLVEKHKLTCSQNPSRLSKFSCEKCNMQFGRKDNLRRHVSLKRCSASEDKKTKPRHLCLFQQCNFTSWHKTDLIAHLKDSHSDKAKILPVQNLKFDDWEQFKNWKDEEEKHQYSYFSEQYGHKDGHYYYYCQQDGPRRAKSVSNDPNNVVVEGENSGENSTPNDGPASKRRKKSCNKKGRMKTGFTCIAMMKVLKTETGVEVQYFPTHNHVQYEADLKHQPLTEATNCYINKHLAFGASPRKIIKTLRGDKFSRVNRKRTDMKLTRNDFITIKALRERKRKMAAEKSLHSNDSDAVYMRVQSLREEDNYNPILIYKPERRELVYGPESAKSLPSDVFMLGLQTEEQAEMMKMASQTILIVDATHDMDQYGHQLLNVVGVDELNRGYPLAHLISSKMDEHTLKYFFEALNLRLPDLDINCVITDDDPALINSMNLGFGQLIRHILCDWHFKRTIQGQLHTKVKDTQLEDQMFKELCVIIDCSQETEFNLTLSAFKKKYENEEKTRSFINYFTQTNDPKKFKWAKCFRKSIPHGNVETTMYVESFHNILKTVYLKRKPNKRIETLLNLLLDIEEDYYARRKTTIGSAAPREEYMKHITERHLKGFNIPCHDVQQYDENGLKYWVIKSQSSPGKEYKVFQNSVGCTRPEMCFFQCNSTDCFENLCSHMYMCTCPDEILLCKHIHKIHSKFSEKRSLGSSAQAASVVEFHYIEENDNSFNDNNTRQNKEEEDLLKSLEELSNYIKNDSVRKTLYPHLRANITAMLAQCRSVVDQDVCDQTLPGMTATLKHTSREKLKCQLKPFTNKKKTSKKKLSYQKSKTPKFQEKAVIKRDLLAASSSSSSDHNSCAKSNVPFSENLLSIEHEVELNPDTQLSEVVCTTTANQPTIKPKLQFVSQPIFSDHNSCAKSNVSLSENLLSIEHEVELNPDTQFSEVVRTTTANQPAIKPKVQFVSRPIFTHGKPSTKLKDKHNLLLE